MSLKLDPQLLQLFLLKLKHFTEEMHLIQQLLPGKDKDELIEYYLDLVEKSYLESYFHFAHIDQPEWRGIFIEVLFSKFGVHMKKEGIVEIIQNDVDLFSKTFIHKVLMQFFRGELEGMEDLKD
jgi:hypothetical protein